MIGTPEASEWVTIAADTDDVPQPGEIGKLRTELSARFAYRAEADTWLAEMQRGGYDGTIASCACSYYGPTDAPGNCWSVSVSKITGRVVAEPR